MIILDGKHGEGGGAMLRFALALSLITKKSFRMINIRSNRPKKGLKHEHLGAIKIMKELCNAKVTDAFLESEEITFIPGEIKKKNSILEYEFKTAASTILVCQSLLLASIFSEKNIRFKLIGGTDVKWSIPADYFKNVLIPILEEQGLKKIIFKINKRGYYPKGQGEVELIVNSRQTTTNIKKINLESRGELLGFFGNINSSFELEKAKVCERAKERAEQTINSFLNKKSFETNQDVKSNNFRLNKDHEKISCNINMSYSKTSSEGAIMTLWARFQNSIIGSDSLGEKGKKAELLGEEATNKLLEFINSKAVVDEYLADQLIPYLGICKGSIKTNKITNHLKSNIYVTQQFLDVLFEINEEKGTIKVD